jgi:hypothetical protein
MYTFTACVLICAYFSAPHAHLQHVPLKDGQDGLAKSRRSVVVLQGGVLQACSSPFFQTIRPVLCRGIPNGSRGISTDEGYLHRGLPVWKYSLF